MADHIPNLGQVPDATACRDAVHVAVAPVLAFTELKPGQRVRLRPDLKIHLWCEPADQDAIGIVDPFLTQPVEKGQRFWLFLFPGTITGLRHSWTHPAFRARIPGE